MTPWPVNPLNECIFPCACPPSPIVCLLFMPVRRWPWLCTYKGQWPSREGRPCRRRSDEVHFNATESVSSLAYPRGRLPLFPGMAPDPEPPGMAHSNQESMAIHALQNKHLMLSQHTKFFYRLALNLPSTPIKLFKTEVSLLHKWSFWRCFQGTICKITSFRLKNFRRLRS